MLLNLLKFTGTATNYLSESLSVNCLSPVVWELLRGDGRMSA